MNNSKTCAEATIDLLQAYGVTTVFGIPGVHTLDFCRALDGEVKHVQTRNEQGAGFMAEGWARATGEPGVALVISGPGVTNALTALAQAYADSLPLLLISAETPSDSLGRGEGLLHEITEQRRVSEPVTALSITALTPADVPHCLARAFAIFKSARPRPVHLAIPIDVQAMQVEEAWLPTPMPSRPVASAAAIQAALPLLQNATSPCIIVGGGATDCGPELERVASAIGAPVIATSAGKGIIADDHELSLSASLMRPEVQEYLKAADVILAIGTELAETDTFVERLELPGNIIRIDIDAGKLHNPYPAAVAILGDAHAALVALLDAFADSISSSISVTGSITAEHTGQSARKQPDVTELKQSIHSNLTQAEQRHVGLLNALQQAAPENTIWAGDACQVVYTATFALPVAHPRHFFFPAGYCALGNALPNAIGAKMAKSSSPVAVLVGDGGFLFTVQELLTAAEQQLGFPIILWDNAGYQQIRDDMQRLDIPEVGVNGLNPNYLALAQACHCHAIEPDSMDACCEAFANAFNADRPTLIRVQESASWL